MNRLLARVLVVLAIVAGLTAGSVAAPEPAHAAGVVYVDMSVPGTWWGATQYGVGYTDRYTGSTAVWAPCPYNGSRCVIIRPVFHSYSWVAVTYPGYPIARIDVNPYDSWYSFSALANTMAHEYAHASGITWHTDWCGNIMYYRLRCGSGALRSWSFTWYQRSVLASH